MTGIASVALYFAGLGAIVYGCWLIYHPAGWIVGGILVFVVSLLLDRLKGRHESR